VLYTHLTPEVAAMLLQFGQHGVRDVIFYRFDDDLDRFVDTVPWARVEPPPQRAA
jgi:hypothetical protein